MTCRSQELQRFDEECVRSSQGDIDVEDLIFGGGLWRLGVFSCEDTTKVYFYEYPGHQVPTSPLWRYSSFAFPSCSHVQ